jgi:hypothetical protein
MAFISQFLHLRQGRYFILSDGKKIGIQMPNNYFIFQISIW